LIPTLPGSWQEALGGELAKPYFAALREFVGAERAKGPVFPADPRVFSALQSTPLDEVKVLLLGQDPYHGPGQAHGLAFSVPPGVPPPPSLVNILRELRDDLGCPAPAHGCLTPWARRGVLLLNAVLTVRAHEPNSHKGRGWERFTDEVIRRVDAKPEPVVFLLWGAYAQKKAALIDTARHTVLTAAHPSPLSARCGFFGSRPFSRINAALRAAGRGEIDWRLPENATSEALNEPALSLNRP
jgi:uracil-DNA glycosylase